MTQYEQENYFGGSGGGEVDDELLETAWEESLAETPNHAPEQERPSVPAVPGPDSVNEAQ